MSSDQPEVQALEKDRRDGIRIATEMWVRVIGRDAEPVRRNGNICGSGFFFEVEEWPGRPGDISVMEVSSSDRAYTFTSMARVVRVVRAKEARWGTGEQGVSFQFLPADESTRVAIAQTVRHIAEQHPEQAGELMLSDFTQAASVGASPAMGEPPSLRIETGEEVRLVVAATTGGGTREVTGVVGDITESVQADGATRYWVPIYMVEEQPIAAAEPAPVQQPIAAAEPAAVRQPVAQPQSGPSLIDSMWESLVPEARSIIEQARSEDTQAGTSHLSGRLSQISMPSALWLLDQEKLSGSLEFRREGEEIVLFLQDGRVIDAESPSCERCPRDLLGALMGWDDGEFVFRVEKIEREDRIGVPTQGLLLALAVQNDHADR
jgi:hypothetical protein